MCKTSVAHNSEQLTFLTTSVTNIARRQGSFWLGTLMRAKWLSTATKRCPPRIVIYGHSTVYTQLMGTGKNKIAFMRNVLLLRQKAQRRDTN